MKSTIEKRIEKNEQERLYKLIRKRIGKSSIAHDLFKNKNKGVLITFFSFIHSSFYTYYVSKGGNNMKIYLVNNEPKLVNDLEG